MAYIIELPTFTTKGTLTVIDDILPFEIKRVYYIYNVNDENIVRAGHRHKKNWQALICLKGSCTIFTNDGTTQKEFVLNNPTQCLIVKPQDWHTIHHFSSDAILLVLASTHYDINDYIDEPY